MNSKMGIEPIFSGIAFRSVCRGPTFFYVRASWRSMVVIRLTFRPYGTELGMFSRATTFLFLSIISIYSVRNNRSVIPNSAGVASENSSRYW